MKHLLLALTIGLFSIQSSYGEDKHIFEDDLLPVVKAFWKIILGDEPRESIEGLPSNEDFAKKILPEIKKAVPLSEKDQAKLRKNKPIRDPKIFTKALAALIPKRSNEPRQSAGNICAASLACP